MGEQPEPPGDVIAQLTVVAEAEVIPGPETLAAKQAEAEQSDASTEE